MARILVVDDDRDIRHLAEKILSHYGHATIVVEDAIKAMEILNTTTFDMIITDANMPHYSGFKLIKTIRNQDHLKHMSIVMLTGLRERKDVEFAIVSGADDYIVKPLDPILFIQKVDSLFEKRPPSQHPEVEFTERSTKTAATVFFQVHVRTISELGVTIETTQHLVEGTTVDLKGVFFEQHLEIEPPPCRVLSCQAQGTSGYVVQTVFLGANEYQLKKIRQWIFSHGSMIRRKDKRIAA
jgi:DNA-binding response OmpR family regulator